MSSHDQVIQWTNAKVRVYSNSALCWVKMTGVLTNVKLQEGIGIFSEIGIWKHFAGKHSEFRITVRDNSIHKVQ